MHAGLKLFVSVFNLLSIHLSIHLSKCHLESGLGMFSPVDSHPVAQSHANTQVQSSSLTKITMCHQEKCHLH